MSYPLEILKNAKDDHEVDQNGNVARRLTHGPTVKDGCDEVPSKDEEKEEFKQEHYFSLSYGQSLNP